MSTSIPYFSIAKQYSPANGKFDERLYQRIVCYADFLTKGWWPQALNPWEREAWKYMEAHGRSDLRRAVEKAWETEMARRAEVGDA